MEFSVENHLSKRHLFSKWNNKDVYMWILCNLLNFTCWNVHEPCDASVEQEQKKWYSHRRGEKNHYNVWREKDSQKSTEKRPHLRYEYNIIYMASKTHRILMTPIRRVVTLRWPRLFEIQWISIKLKNLVDKSLDMILHYTQCCTRMRKPNK